MTQAEITPGEMIAELDAERRRTRTALTPRDEAYALLMAMLHRIRLLRTALDGKVTEMLDARERFESLQASAQSRAGSLQRYCETAEKLAQDLYQFSDDEVEH